ncbi:IclR family transcriptional regulator C-terminal domain-containing protein [Salmonella enterica]|uniref:IclR family transcriptional regulator C-terminal domain-containing protein n=1 Tax=Salmonella enterica TaxID=28901 RepID=UPI001E2F9533|nr:IclR family transcriptional regulator C-terminal domain-containing protein [Salmonella enterica]
MNRDAAFDNEEDSLGIYCIAAPVFNRSQEVVAAISISGVEVQLPQRADPRLFSTGTSGLSGALFKVEIEPNSTV